ncbi:hypothetical protein DPMN_012964 [Dreissena polymorpha]|uniref:Uncharacterized protein n=1 Tax=Dreissena polymorpha TaxID=45954 RepID=A0A9D4N812_DREPO|nr:hypothetical protein DPMN_012964 [Dreissena polymorpha]
MFVGGFAHSAGMFFFTMSLHMFSHMSPSTCLVFTYLTLDLSSALFPGRVGI